MKTFWISATLIVLLGTVGGCGVRLATSEPTEPVADLTELARDHVATTAWELSQAAAEAAASSDQTTSGVLTHIESVSAEHLTALGGLDDTTNANTPIAVPSTTSAAQVLKLLADAAQSAAAEAINVPDPQMARLLAAVAVARFLLHDELSTAVAAASAQSDPAAATGSPAPTAAPSTTPAAVPPALQPTVATAPGPAPTATGENTGASPEPSTNGDPSTTGDHAGGLAPEAGAPLILALDQAGYGLEVAAAQARGDFMVAAQKQAALDRRAAAVWAARTGLAGTATDPRHPAYQTPPDLDDVVKATQMAAELEAAVVQAYGVALGGSQQQVRLELITGMLTTMRVMLVWGGEFQTLPGNPLSQTPQPSVSPT